MEIIIHRGTHQIGGCITEIKSKKGTRIFIDIGENLPSLDENQPEIEIEGLFSAPSDCDGVFITHYHGDHLGLLNQKLPDIPVYMGQMAFKIYEVVAKTLKKDMSNFVALKTFVQEQRIVIKEDIIVTPYRVDHSAYDSYMFLVECDGERILHTGDFRTHGWSGKGVIGIAQKLIRHVDVIICEGTMMSRMNEKVMTEFELKTKAKKFIKENDVFVLCSSTNIDTIAAFYHATNENGKLFVCDAYQKEILSIVASEENIKKSSIYNLEMAKIYWEKREETIKAMKRRGFCCLVRANGAKIFPTLIKKFPHAKVIYSMFAGYLDETKPYKIPHFVDFVNEFNALTDGWHTSGHATRGAIKEFCSILKPKYIIPLHTEKPENFEKVAGAELILLSDGETFFSNK